jgi:endoglucanase
MRFEIQKWTRCHLGLVLAGLLVGACGGAASQAATSSEGAVTGAQLVWRGVSLAVAEFGENELPGTYGTQYIYPNPSSAAYFAGKGMNLVRLPFRWERLQPKPNGEFDATELGRMKSFVSTVTAAGTTVIIDPHNYARYYGKLIGSNDVPVAVFADFWTRLAIEFKANPKVMFGLMNEPHDMATESWVSSANAAIAAIRATGASNTITVPGNAWTGAGTWSDTWYGTPNAVAMLKIADSGNNLLIEAHQYFDQDSSGTQPVCVSPTIGSQRLAGFTTWLRTNHRRGLLGEIGGANNSVCNLAVADALNYLTANADVWTGWVWWAAGPWWGDQFLSIEPGANGVDKPQMKVLAPYLK